MNEIFIWVVPPVIGAFIGYVTNAIAIKMLFRPLKEIRLLGVKLPFTPGILPRERGKLADSIGRMVEQELIPPGVLRDRLAKPDVRDKMERTIAEYSEQIADRPLSYWFEERPGDFPFVPLVRNFINSEIFDSFLETIIGSWLKGRDSSGEDKNSYSLWIKSRMRDFGSLFVPAAKNLIKGSIARDIKNQAQGETSIYRSAMESIAVKYPGITLREFISLGGQQKLEIDSFLAARAQEALDKNMESTLASVDVKILVSERINSLDMPKVEKIVLDVMAGQLKWINFFGAILGALIGFVQVLLGFIRSGG